MNARVSVALLTFCAASVPAVADLVSVTPVRDNTLFEHPSGTLSNGAGLYLFAGTTDQPAGLARRRALLAFDLASAIPPGSAVTDAHLILHCSRTVVGFRTHGLHLATANWGSSTSNAGGQEGAGGPAVQGDATWLHTFYNRNFWSAPGGDFDPVPSSTVAVGGLGFYTVPSTPRMVADVQGWVDNPAGNFGWILLGDESAFRTAKRFDSRENSPSFRPTLVVTFTPSQRCCFPDGSCAAASQSLCDAAGGTPLPDSTVCEGDADADGVDQACGDECPADPDKLQPGLCGCGTSELDTDSDGTPDCLDQCPTDPDKVSPGQCGCGTSDVDSDAGPGCDAVPDCLDACPTDCRKTQPGVCGCGADDSADTDDDGVPDCLDLCPGVNDAIFPAPQCQQAIPAVSHWGLLILALALLSGGKLRALDGAQRERAC